MRYDDTLAIWILILPFFVVGCSGSPRLVILHDPLTAAEHVQLGIAYETQGDLDLALAEYQAALRKDHRHVQALVNLGNVHTQLKEYSEAERYYRAALQLDVNHPMANNNLAWVLILQGTDLTEAEGLIHRAIVSDPNRRAVYLDTLAYLYLQRGRLTEALTILEEAETHLPLDDESLKAHLATTRTLIIRAMQSGGGGAISLPDPPQAEDRPEGTP